MKPVWKTLAAALITSTLLLFPSPAAAQCNPSYDPDCGTTPGTGPDVGMNPNGGTYTADGAGAKVPVTIFMSDADGLNQSTLQVRLWNGASYVPVSFPWNPSTDGTRVTLKGDLDLTIAGDNILMAQIADMHGNVGAGTATFRLEIPDPDLPVVSWEPHHNEYRNTGLGAFVLGYPAWSYTSMGVTRAIGLAYNSEQTGPTAFVQVDARPEPRTASEVVAMSLRIEQWSADPTTPRTLVGRESFYAKGDGRFQRMAVYWSLTDVPTGAYRYWAVVRSYKANGSYKEQRSVVRVLVINEKASRYGAGWSVAGIQRLHSNGSDGLLLNEGNGVARFFKGVCSAACTYETPAGDFSTLGYRPDSVTWLRTYTNGSQVVFDRNGLMISAADRFGNTTTYEWQSSGGTAPQPVLARIIDPVGQVTSFAYQPDGYLRSITTAGRTLYCAYNTRYQLSSISGPPNLVPTYNAAHQMLSYNTNYSGGGYTETGITSTITYDAFRQLRTFKGPMIMVGGKLGEPKTTYRSPQVRTVPPSSLPNDLANLAAPIPFDTLLLEVTDPRTHTTRIALDRYGNTTRTIDAEGITTTSTWTKHGLPEWISTTSGNSGYLWNDNGQLLQQTEGGGTVYEASYDGSNLPEFVASGGTALWYAYGPRGEVLRTWPGRKEDEQRAATTYTYNARYQPIRTIGPKGERVEWSYEGNVFRNPDYVRITREDGTILTTTFTYDEWSRQRTVTNPAGQTTTTEYDSHNRVIRVLDPLNRPTRYDFTGPNLTRVTDPNGKVFEFTYNTLGWLESERFPGDQTSRTYTYNADGLVLSATDRRGKTVTFTYNASHLLTDRTADGVTTTFRYPDMHNTTIATNAESVVTTRLIQGSGVLGSISTTLAGRRYDIKRSLDMYNGWRDNGFDLETYINDALQRTDRVRYHTQFNPTDPSLGSTYQIEDMSGRRTTMSFDTAGRPVSTVFPVGVTQYNWFTSDGRLDSTTFSTSTVNQKLGATFGYDALGRLGSRTSILQDRQWVYGYNSLGQVSQYGIYRMATLGNCNPSFEDCPPPDWVPVTLEEYTYDASGNRTDRGAVVAPGTNRYTAFDGFTLQYDAEGNLTRKYKPGVLDQTFTWDSLGLLTAVTTNGTTVSYGYDAYGRRVRRTENGQSRHYLYNNHELLLETDYNGDRMRMYTHWPGIDLPNSVHATSGGQEFVYYYTMEHPGNVTGLLNTLGNVAGEHRYKPFGEVESASDPAGQPLRFMGRELDFGTDLYYVRNRWYDPALARFISQDPLGLAGGTNTYAYAENDPVNKRDPMGLFSQCALGGPVKLTAFEHQILRNRVEQEFPGEDLYVILQKSGCSANLLYETGEQQSRRVDLLLVDQVSKAIIHSYRTWQVSQDFSRGGDPSGTAQTFVRCVTDANVDAGEFARATSPEPDGPVSRTNRGAAWLSAFSVDVVADCGLGGLVRGAVGLFRGPKKP